MNEQQNLQSHGREDEKTQIIKYEERFSGPLPHPSILEKYNKIVPGAAERILKEFEHQTAHRQKIERTVIKTDSIKALLGLTFGFIIAMTTILGGIYTALQGKPLLGGSLSFAGLALLVGAFIVSKISNDTDEENED